MATYGNRAATTTYYRPASYVAQPPVRGPNVTDDYERWYTEAVPNNRMTLSLRSGIDSEITWALDRLCRLCHNEQFLLRGIPGLMDALYEWPEWYATTGYKETTELQHIFSPSSELLRRRQHALESLFILRNASLLERNSAELAGHPHTMPLILNALHNLDPNADENSEFILHVVEIFHAVAPGFILPPNSSPPRSSPLYPILRIASDCSNRSLIIAALVALSQLFSNTQNSAQLTPGSPALTASIRYLPLFTDKPLLEASLNYLYAHLSHPAMAKAFLTNPSMPSVLRLLVSLLSAEQIRETVTLDITGTIQTVPSTILSTRNHELSQAELESLLSTPEPQRCYDWMKTMFVAKPDGELTQVDFWNLYKDVFLPHQEKYPLLVASDVIKNVNFVFPQAQAMVLPGPPQRFIVRGVDRRKDMVVAERLKCQWDRSQCPTPAFNSPKELCEHVLQHLEAIEASESPCLWSKCSKSPVSKQSLRAHVLTHLWSQHNPDRHPSQSDTITLSSPSSPYPDPNPTIRTPPLPRSTVINYTKPAVDPPSSSLTALLCIRILFRASFAETEAAPRIDGDHFGFPGIVEEMDEADVIVGAEGGASDVDREGQRRGKKAFVSVRRLMEGIEIKDDILMSWITEMMDAALEETN